MSGRRRGPLVVVGEALLDVDIDGAARRLSPDSAAPVVEEPRERARPGGAALAAHLAALAGGDVVLIAPLGADQVSERIRVLLHPGVRVVPLGTGGAPARKVRVRAAGRTVARVDFPGHPGDGRLSPDAAAAIGAAGALLVSDYGGGVTANRALRELLTSRAARVPLVWDPHPRGAEPVAGTFIATPNQAEAAAAGETPSLASADGSSSVHAALAAAERLLEKWTVAHVCVTLGAKGALLHGASGPLFVPAPAIHVADACGAGDMFAAALGRALRTGALVSEATADAVAGAAAFLAAGGVADLGAPGDGEPATRPRAAADPFELAASVRARGGTVVATGGCFDLLHAGHIRCLRAARAAGDCLIVCLNSDASESALKGPGRPLNPQADRVALLEALDCVDAVAVFEEPDPRTVLARLRPHVWVKGGDYEAAELPEAGLVRSWGGRVMTVPYLSGRSTTRLVRAARDGR